MIRFFNLSPKDFLRNVHPYNHQLYENLLAHHLDPESEITHNIILRPRIGTLGDSIDSKIIDIKIASLISTWIDNKTDEFIHIGELYLSYEFKLSRDGFTPKKFHTLCDGKPNTVTFVKVKGTEEILGGFNPLMWSVDSYRQTKYSFIFSFKNKDNFFKDAILSNVNQTNYAIHNHSAYGPCFNSDLVLHSSDGTKDYDVILCSKCVYEKRIRDTNDRLSIEGYEVFQIIKRKV